MTNTLRNLFLILLLSTTTLIAQTRIKEVDKVLTTRIAQRLLKPSDIANYKITSEHTSALSDVRHIYFRQSYQGIEILGTESSIHVKGENVIHQNIKFVNHVSERIKTTNHSVTDISAIQKASQSLGSIGGGIQFLRQEENNVKIYRSPYISIQDIPVKKIYSIGAQGNLIAAWEIFIEDPESKNWFNFYVDANNNEILRRIDRTIRCDFDHDHDAADFNHRASETTSKLDEYSKVSNDNPSMSEGTYTVYPIPFISPHDGDRAEVTDVHDITASPFGWHDVDGVAGPEYTVTRGNNVNTYEDGDNFGFQPDGGSDLIFNFPINTVYSPGDQSESAAITNLFYWNNILHDVMYYYGFDAPSGNFQVNNYGLGGIGGDPVLAEAQDNSGTCNANFSFSVDGQSGRMQMFTCGSRDGDLDNLVIVHEFGHGISTRLAGGAAVSDCLFSSEQMGEGWSDWYGAILTIKPEDVSTDLRPVGNWLFQQDADGPGIRDFPYTTDMTQDPRTYNFIQGASVPHGVGSVWAAMLWDMTWDLIDEYGFDENVYNGDGGNNIALALVTEGLKLQPCNPGFVDGRDAILAADIALYGGANQCLIWNAFAKRGLGVNADQGSPNSLFDGVESFESPATDFNLETEPFCVSEESIVLSGGLPTGGIYEGAGVTDNGDGVTFTFDPGLAGIGEHTISYTADSDCMGGDTAVVVIEVRSDEPIIECQDISVTLDENGLAEITLQDVIVNFPTGEGYTIDQEGTFNPIDIGSGTEVNLGDDQVSPAIPIGFDFNFFNTPYSELYISSNGFITFNPGTNSGCCSGGFIPQNDAINNIIAFAWTDLFPSGGDGEIVHNVIGDAPNRIFALEFNNVSECCGSNPDLTTQILLYETSDRIEIHTTLLENIGTTTQGIENIDGSEGYSAEGRNSTPFSLQNDFIAFEPNTGEFPDNCGNPTTVTIDIDTFDCSNIGENTVTATVIDSEGNTASCSAIVTVISETNVTFELSETLCADQDPIVLGGGLPIGGVYSGTGVTDDGNGETFTIDPSVAGEGSVLIIYESINSCNLTESAEITLEILPGIPEIACQDITVILDETGNVEITFDQVLSGGSATGNSVVYALNRLSATESIARYDYDITTDDLILDVDYNYGTGFTNHFAIDADPTSGLFYYLGANGNAGVRQLFEIDLEDVTSTPVLIDDIISVNGVSNVQNMAFGSDGTLYFVFQGGEINAYDVSTGEIEEFSQVDSNGGVGMTYDQDNNRLLYTTGTAPVSLYGVDIATAAVNLLFTFNTPGNNAGCSAQGIEYIGNNKVISGSTFACDLIYTVDLETQATEVLAQPTGSFPNIKDLLITNVVPVDNCSGEPLSFEVVPASFDCTNIGENTVTIIATDASGNTSECTALVTVTDTSAPVLNCVSSLEVILPESQIATITLDDLLNNSITDNCDDDLDIAISQDTFDCNDIMGITLTEVLVNGSFENDLDNWTSEIFNETDGGLGSCNMQWIVLEDSTLVCCCVEDINPTDGIFAAFTSFDGSADAEYTLSQNFILPIVNSTDDYQSTLSFDWVAEFNFTGAPRELIVEILDESNQVLLTPYTFTINGDSSINESVSLDLGDELSAFIGESLVLRFRALIPEGFTGPSKALIDNVSLMASSNQLPITITATDGSGNVASCIVNVFVLDPDDNCNLSVNEFKSNEVNMYPNPALDYFTISWGSTNVANIEIFDMIGRRIYSRLDINPNNSELVINSTNMASGNYFVIVKDLNNNAVTKRLIVN